MTDRWVEEAREMAVSLGRDYPDVVERIATALAAAHEAGRREEREACARLIEANVLQDTAGGKRLIPRQEGNRDGIYYAAAIRSREVKS